MSRVTTLDHTHEPDAESWIDSANGADTDFPLQNLPFGVFHQAGSPHGRIGVRIGDQVLDLNGLLDVRLLDHGAAVSNALRQSSLNALMAVGRLEARWLRHSLFSLLRRDCNADARSAASNCLIPEADVQMDVPAVIGDFTDFFTSVHHATRSGRISRPDSPLFANFKSIPIAYHGRASSVMPSGTACHRPLGQVSADSGYRPTAKLDFELEVGFLVGSGSRLGQRLAIDDAEDALFGCCLVNDWSARDVQRWEAAPLGPFLAKSFLTTVSPWVVTLDALAPFRRPAADRGVEAPLLDRALTSPANLASGAIDISLGAWLQSREMRRQGLPAVRIASPNFGDQYWNIGQMVTHHASNGCNLRPGDLISSGTVSGPSPDDSGCLLERTVDGTRPIALPTGESRGYLDDGDVLRFTARCERVGYRSIGFGECQSEVAAESLARPSEHVNRN